MLTQSAGRGDRKDRYEPGSRSRSRWIRGGELYKDGSYGSRQGSARSPRPSCPTIRRSVRQYAREHRDGLPRTLDCGPCSRKSSAAAFTGGRRSVRHQLSSRARHRAGVATRPVKVNHIGSCRTRARSIWRRAATRPDAPTVGRTEEHDRRPRGRDEAGSQAARCRARTGWPDNQLFVRGDLGQSGLSRARDSLGLRRRLAPRAPSTPRRIQADRPSPSLLEDMDVSLTSNASALPSLPTCTLRPIRRRAALGLAARLACVRGGLRASQLLRRGRRRSTIARSRAVRTPRRFARSSYARSPWPARARERDLRSAGWARPGEIIYRIRERQHER